MKDDPMTLKQVISKMLDDYHIKNKYKSIEAIKLWKSMMPKMMLDEIEKVFIQRGVFYIKCKSSVIRNHLYYNKSKIIALLNNEIGFKLISSIKLI